MWSEIPATYEQHWNCSKDKKGYSGVAIFTKI
jgi:exonuclease III